MFDVMEQQRCYAAGRRPKTKLCRTHPYGVLMLKVISSLLVYMTASVMAVASPLAHSGSRVVSIRQSTKFPVGGPTLDCRWCLVAYRNAVV